MDASTPELRIMHALKHELKARGFHYRDIATRLKVSEGTVKRYFTGKGVTLTVLRKLGEIADLDLLSLATLVQEQNAGEHTFSKPQQVALSKNKLLSAVFFLLWNGWNPAQIRTEFEIAGALDGALEKLEALKLIRRLGKSVKVLATPNVEQKGGSPLDELTRDNAYKVLSEINLRDPQTEWASYSARLSRASVARLHDMMRKFVEDTRGLSIGDNAVPRDHVQWYHLFVGAQPIARKRILPRG